MSDKYDSVDAAILRAIAAGNSQFSIINTGEVKELASRHSISGQSYRVVDRRLQSLRKRRLATFWKGKWSIANGG